MSAQHFIALDTHCEFCEMVAVSNSGKIVKRERCETTIPALVGALESVRRPRTLTFEEGPLADWLARNLRPHVERLIVCEPRRNALIAKESDKDDPIDAERLAQLAARRLSQGGASSPSRSTAPCSSSTSAFTTTACENASAKGINSWPSCGGMASSLRSPRSSIRTSGSACGRSCRNRKVLRNDLDLVRKVYELLVEQEDELRRELIRLARREEPVRRFEELPGFGWIRSITFYVYIDTPSRFASKSALWRYCGIGLERRHSGSGPLRVRLTKAATDDSKMCSWERPSRQPPEETTRSPTSTPIGPRRKECIPPRLVATSPAA